MQEWRRGLEMLEWAYLSRLPEEVEFKRFNEAIRTAETASASQRYFRKPAWGLHGWRLAAAAGIACALIIGFLIYRLTMPPILGVRLITGNKAQTVRVAHGIWLTVEPNSEVTRITSDWVKLDNGWVTAKINHRQGKFRIQSRRIDVYDMGTRFRVGTDEQSDWVTVQEGSVQVRKAKFTQDIHAGEVLVAKGDSKPVVSKAKEEEKAMSIGSIEASSLMLLFIVLFALSIVFWFKMLLDALRRDFGDGSARIAWVLVIIFLHLLGALIYYFKVVYQPSETGRWWNRPL
jgi:ferric-dicitrate binding protein FerR (iron transport regulator)